MNTTQTSPAADSQHTSVQNQLYRPAEGRMIAGVAGGIARYLDVDVTLVRIVLVVLAFIGGAGLPLYVAGWLLMPDEDSQQSIAGEWIHSRPARSS
jgi:phage shock protein PspC (stress-responsive transcriptional regulator)